ncbi:MAG TPA: hypothetical protein DDZ88_19925 [Verrucomicrobiales bacterium]|nr:hypothetical protein [Verrucomicrobiales bacterium]
MNAVLTQHAQEMLAKRGIDPAWVERALVCPQLVQADKVDPSLEHRFVKIAENGDRVLKVVVNRLASPERVVSAYFDRRMKGVL